VAEREAVVVLGAKELDAKLKKLAKQVAQPKLMFKQIVVEVDAWVLRNIQREGKLIQAGGWRPFKPFTYKGKLYTRGRIIKGRSTGKAYPKWKWKVDSRARLLQDTGRLRQSIRHSYSRWSGKVFTRLPYAIDHHTGTSKLPARPIIPPKTNPDIQKIALRAAKKHIKDAVEGKNGV